MDHERLESVRPWRRISGGAFCGPSSTYFTVTPVGSSTVFLLPDHASWRSAPLAGTTMRLRVRAMALVMMNIAAFPP